MVRAKLKIINTIPVAMCLLGLYGCSSSPLKRHELSEEGLLVRTRFPSFGKCQKLAMVTGVGKDFRDVEIDARNKSAKHGANYLELGVPTGTPKGFIARGMAYQCQAYKNQKFPDID